MSRWLRVVIGRFVPPPAPPARVPVARDTDIAAALQGDFDRVVGDLDTVLSGRAATARSHPAVARSPRSPWSRRFAR